MSQHLSIGENIILLFACSSSWVSKHLKSVCHGTVISYKSGQNPYNWNQKRLLFPEHPSTTARTDLIRTRCLLYPFAKSKPRLGEFSTTRFNLPFHLYSLFSTSKRSGHLINARLINPPAGIQTEDLLQPRARSSPPHEISSTNPFNHRTRCVWY